jgi:hypothetical protein
MIDSGSEKTVQEHEAMILNAGEAEVFLKHFQPRYVSTKSLLSAG